jgi:hypothetical protein
VKYRAVAMVQAVEGDVIMAESEEYVVLTESDNMDDVLEYLRTHVELVSEIDRVDAI